MDEVNDTIGDRDVLQVDHSPDGQRMRVIVSVEGTEPREEALFFRVGRLVRRQLLPPGEPRPDMFEAFAKR